MKQALDALLHGNVRKRPGDGAAQIAPDDHLEARLLADGAEEFDERHVDGSHGQ